jgi:hypothetical protein
MFIWTSSLVFLKYNLGFSFSYKCFVWSKIKFLRSKKYKLKKKKKPLLSSHLCRISCRWIRVRVQIHGLVRSKSISDKGMYGPKIMNGRSLYAKHAYCDIFPCFCFILPSPNHNLLACPARRGKTLHGCRIFGLQGAELKFCKTLT